MNYVREYCQKLFDGFVDKAGAPYYKHCEFVGETAYRFALSELGMSKEDANPVLLSEYGKEMDELQQKLNEMSIVEEMTSARQRFSEMMTQVNKVLEFIITGEVAQGGGCSGNCGSCGGCH